MLVFVLVSICPLTCLTIETTKNEKRRDNLKNCQVGLLTMLARGRNRCKAVSGILGKVRYFQKETFYTLDIQLFLKSRKRIYV